MLLRKKYVKREMDGATIATTNIQTFNSSIVEILEEGC